MAISIVTPVFSVTRSFRNLLKKHFWLLSMLKTVVLLNTLVETVHYYSTHFFRILWWTEHSKEQHLFEIEIFCKMHLRWWVGGWQTCSATCGPDGVRKRTILCVRTVAGEERVLHPGDCKQLLKPKPVVPCNRDLPCGFEWMVGNWSEVGTCIIN